MKWEHKGGIPLQVEILKAQAQFRDFPSDTVTGDPGDGVIPISQGT